MQAAISAQVIPRAADLQHLCNVAVEKDALASLEFLALRDKTWRAALYDAATRLADRSHGGAVKALAVKLKLNAAGGKVRTWGAYQVPNHSWANMRIAEHIQALGLDFNRRDASGKTYLDGVTSSSVYAFALDHGADPRAVACEGGTALHRIAGHYGFKGLVARIVAYGVKVDAQDAQGRTALHLADDWGFVHAILAAGADFSICDHHGEAAYDVLSRKAAFGKKVALYMAARGSERALRPEESLQEEDPEADWVDRYWASTRPPERCPDAIDVALKLLRAPSAGLTRILANHLRLAAGRDATNDLPLIELAAALGCSFRRINGDGQTFAHIVVMSRQPMALRFLHTLGIPVDQADFEGRTPLLYAVAGKDDDCSEALIQAGADTVRVKNFLATQPLPDQGQPSNYHGSGTNAPMPSVAPPIINIYEVDYLRNRLCRTEQSLTAPKIEDATPQKSLRSIVEIVDGLLIKT